MANNEYRVTQVWPVLGPAWAGMTVASVVLPALFSTAMSADAGIHLRIDNRMAPIFAGVTRRPRFAARPACQTRKAVIYFPNDANRH